MLRATNVIQPDGASVATVYNLKGQLQETYGSRTYPVAYTYDYAGRMSTMTTWQNFSANSGAAVTTWNYDPYQGFLANKAYADGNGPSYTYTPAGRLSSRTWARSVAGSPLVTSYVYDTAGGVTNVNYSDGTTPAVGTVYDRQGRPTTIYQGGIVTADSYNLAGELLGESYTGGPLNGLTVTNTYDSDLRRTTLSALNGTTPLLTTTYGYDNASRLITVNDGNNNTATYSYLANSSLVGQIVFKQSGSTRMTTTKQYDYLNRLTGISSQPSGSGLLPISYSYAYNAANQRTENTFADGSHWVYTYDSLGQVTSGKRYWSDGTPVAGQQFDYTFDTIGNRTQTQSGGDTNGANLRVANYHANLLNQLTNRNVPGTNDIIGVAMVGTNVTVNGQATDRKIEYFHGIVGTNNSPHAAWLTATIAGAGTTQAGHLYVAQQPEQFQYDLDGNLTNDGRWAYTWDAENRLVAMTVNTNVGPQCQLTFAYDFKGQRIQKIVTTNSMTFATNNYVYDDWNLVAETKPNNSLIRTYFWGNDYSGSLHGAGGSGGLIEVTCYGTAITNSVVASDGNGNVASLVNSADGTVEAAYEYGPFGEVIRSDGPLASQNALRFSTKFEDSESEIVYYGYRFLKTSSGAWLNRDFLDETGGLNLYGFVKNNPISSSDNFGLWTWTEASALGQLVAEHTDWLSKHYDFAAALLEWFYDKKGPAQFNGTPFGAAEIHSSIQYNTAIKRFLRSKCPYAGKIDVGYNNNPGKEAFGARYWYGSSTSEMDLFYALYGAHFGLDGYMFCGCSGPGFFAGAVVQKDFYTFPSGIGRGLSPNYSAAMYLESVGYKPFVDVQLWWDVIIF